MGIKPRRKRPANLPADAYWDQQEECWGAGARDGAGNKCGTWNYFWTKSGAPAGTVEYDQQGRRHGPSHWVHPNGELWQSGTYVHGIMHGRFSWQQCSVPSPGPIEFVAASGQISDDVVRMDMPFVDGAAQSYHMTFYNRLGADAPLDRDEHGRTANLGSGLGKLVVDTTLLMTEARAHSVEGVEVLRPDDDTRVVFKGLHDSGCKVLFRPAFGTAREHVFSGAEMSRAFTLSSDYLLAHRSARAAEAKANAAALAARRERFRAIPIANQRMATYEFLRGMYSDDYFPDALVDKIKAILVRLCKEIEAAKPQDEDSILALTHAATEEINALEQEFADGGSELETAAREVMAEDFGAIVEAYGFDALDIEDVIAPRDW